MIPKKWENPSLGFKLTLIGTVVSVISLIITLFPSNDGNIKKEIKNLEAKDQGINFVVGNSKNVNIGEVNLGKKELSKVSIKDYIEEFREIILSTSIEESEKAQLINAQINNFFPELTKNQKDKIIKLLGASNIKGISFKNFDLSNIDFKDTNFVKANFSNATFQNTNFKNANLIDTNFINAKINLSDFSNSSLSNSNFEKSKIINSLFKSINANNSKFHSTEIVNSDFSSSKLLDSDFTLAKFNKGSLLTSDCSNSKFIEANLTDSDLRGVIFKNSDLRMANLTGSMISNKQLGIGNITLKEIKYRTIGEPTEKTLKVSEKNNNGNLKITMIPFEANFENANLSNLTWIDGNKCIDKSIGKCLLIK